MPMQFFKKIWASKLTVHSRLLQLIRTGEFDRFACKLAFHLSGIDGFSAKAYAPHCASQIEAGARTKADRVWLARGRKAAVQRYAVRSD